MRKQIGEWNVACKEHFQKCDAERISGLLAERTAGTEKAKKLLDQIEKLQRSNGLRSSAQTTLQNDLSRAQQAVMDFAPVNRSISSMESIHESEVEVAKLRKAAGVCKEHISQNQREMLNCGEQIRQLQREYSAWQTREEPIVHEIAELQKPPEDRKKASSIVWQNGDAMFGLQLPS